jgi:hypothetical protein
VVDGRADLSRWFLAGDGPEGMVKVDWDQGSSWNLGLACCDPIFDLAVVTASSQDVALARELRRAYEGLGGGKVDDERWLLYELAYLTAGPDARRDGRPAVRRACARAVQNYFRRVYFDDLDPSYDGPLCGIDIDGVLETEHLGFPALTPSSAVGLRALLAHGYRPLAVTGRSVVDVIDRCHAYRLAGGVAEYGLVIYDAVSERMTVLASDGEQDAIARLRTELRTDGIELDEDYTHAIRAFVRDGCGGRGPVPQQMLARTAALAGTVPIRAIRGERQTDFVPDRIDKGRGTLALAAALRADDADGGKMAPRPLAFAIGDTTNDIPLLALAERPFVPAHAGLALGSRPVVTRAPYQRGFAEAVARLIGHKPGSCAHCRLPASSRERHLLLDLLGMGEWGIARRPWQLLKLRALA